MMNELMHYGVKGQKWGVRRYQNKDWSLTVAGKKKYSIDNPQLSKAKDRSKRLREDLDTYSKVRYKTQDMYADAREAKKTGVSQEEYDAIYKKARDYAASVNKFLDEIDERYEYADLIGTDELAENGRNYIRAFIYDGTEYLYAEKHA